MHLIQYCTVSINQEVAKGEMRRERERGKEMDGMVSERRQRRERHG